MSYHKIENMSQTQKIRNEAVNCHPMHSWSIDWRKLVQTDAPLWSHYLYWLGFAKVFSMPTRAFSSHSALNTPRRHTAPSRWKSSMSLSVNWNDISMRSPGSRCNRITVGGTPLTQTAWTATELLSPTGVRHCIQRYHFENVNPRRQWTVRRVIHHLLWPPPVYIHYLLFVRGPW